MNDSNPNCDEIRQAIEQLGGRGAEDAEVDLLQEHLAACSECRRLYEERLRLDELLGQWNAPEPNVNIPARAMAKILAVDRAQNTTQPSPDFRTLLMGLLRLRFPIPAAAMLAMFVLLACSLSANLVLLRGARRGITAATSPGSLQIAREPVVTNHEPPGHETVPRSVMDRHPVVAWSFLDNADYKPTVLPGVLQPAVVIIFGAPPVEVAGHSYFGEGKGATAQHEENSL